MHVTPSSTERFYDSSAEVPRLYNQCGHPQDDSYHTTKSIVGVISLCQTTVHGGSIIYSRVGQYDDRGLFAVHYKLLILQQVRGKFGSGLVRTIMLESKRNCRKGEETFRCTHIKIASNVDHSSKNEEGDSMKSRWFNLTILSGAIASSLAMVHIASAEAATNVASVQVQPTNPGTVGHVNDTKNDEESQHDEDSRANDDQDKPKHNDDQDKQHTGEDHDDHGDEEDDEDDDDD